jgi:hypothetical protein
MSCRMEKKSSKYRYLVRIWQTGTCHPGRSYPFTEEQEARNAYDVALKLYDADIFTVQLFDNDGVGELARR